jgi:hypothetical protein
MEGCLAWTDVCLCISVSVCPSSDNNTAGSGPALTPKQRQAGASYAAAKAGLQRSISAGAPLAALSKVSAPKPVVVKAAATASKPISVAAVQQTAGNQQQRQQQQQKVLGRGFALPLSVDVTKGGLFDLHVRVNGRRK